MEISLTQLQFDRIIELLSKANTAFCQGLKNNLKEQAEPAETDKRWNDAEVIDTVYHFLGKTEIDEKFDEKIIAQLLKYQAITTV